MNTKDNVLKNVSAVFIITMKVKRA